MSTLVVGDIHGCREELLELVDKAGVERVLSVGDVLDRGPDSPGTLRLFQDGTFSMIQGNHERKHTLIHKGVVKPSKSQVKTMNQYGAGWEGIIPFLDQLPRYALFPSALVVHASYQGGVPLEKQNEVALVGGMSGTMWLAKQQGTKNWWEQYVLHETLPIVFGHNSLNGVEPFIYKDLVYGLDTQCATGGRLTGLVLPEFRIVQVNARKNYWHTHGAGEKE